MKVNSLGRFAFCLTAVMPCSISVTLIAYINDILLCVRSIRVNSNVTVYVPDALFCASACSLTLIY